MSEILNKSNWIINKNYSIVKIPDQSINYNKSYKYKFNTTGLYIEIKCDKLFNQEIIDTIKFHEGLILNCYNNLNFQYIPNSIKVLFINIIETFYKFSITTFNNSLAYLPHSICRLRISTNLAKPIIKIDKLPSSIIYLELKYLIFAGKYTHNLPLNIVNLLIYICKLTYLNSLPNSIMYILINIYSDDKVLFNVPPKLILLQNGNIYNWF